MDPTNIDLIYSIIFGYCALFEDSLVMINSAECGRKTKYAITGAVKPG